MIRTLAELNERNRTFWAEQNALMEHQLLNEPVLHHALKMMATEEVRGTPVYYRRSNVEMLHEAEGMLRASATDPDRKELPTVATVQRHVQQARRRCDPFSGIIYAVAYTNLMITEHELLNVLRKMQGHGVIQEIDDQYIYLCWPKRVRGKASKTLVVITKVPLSALKDRLSRAKARVRLAKKVH